MQVRPSEQSEVRTHDSPMPLDVGLASLSPQPAMSAALRLAAPIKDSSKEDLAICSSDCFVEPAIASPLGRAHPQTPRALPVKARAAHFVTSLNSMRRFC